MTFEELRKQSLELIKEAKSHSFLSPKTHPLNEKKDNLKRQYLSNTTDDEYEVRLFQIKGLGFLGNIDQFACHKQSEEDWIKLFDELQKITKEDIQKMADDRKKEDEKRVATIKKRLEQKALIKQPKILTISERSVNYLYGQLKMKGIARFDSSGQKLNHKLLWAVDFLSSKLSKKCGFDKGKKSEVVLFENALTFFNFMGDIKNGLIPSKYTFVDIQFKASEVRDWLGFTSDEISLREVVDLFRGLQRVIFEAEGEPILRDAEKKEWVKTTVSDTLFSLRRDNLGIISNRWKTKDVILNLRFQNIMSWLFIANLSCGKEGRITLPKKAIHELDGYGQNVLRWLRLWKKPREINVIELANIAGLKNKEVKKLIHSLIRILIDLKQKSYIKSYKSEGKGKNTQFEIIKAENVLKVETPRSKG